MFVLQASNQSRKNVICCVLYNIRKPTNLTYPSSCIKQIILLLIETKLSKAMYMNNSLTSMTCFSEKFWQENNWKKGLAGKFLYPSYVLSQISLFFPIICIHGILALHNKSNQSLFYPNLHHSKEHTMWYISTQNLLLSCLFWMSKLNVCSTMMENVFVAIYFS